MTHSIYEGGRCSDRYTELWTEVHPSFPRFMYRPCCSHPVHNNSLFDLSQRCRRFSISLQSKTRKRPFLSPRYAAKYYHSVYRPQIESERARCPFPCNGLQARGLGFHAKHRRRQRGDEGRIICCILFCTVFFFLSFFSAPRRKVEHRQVDVREGSFFSTPSNGIQQR